ncbi:MAG: tRNA modification GTPase [Flavobacterium sp.]
MKKLLLIALLFSYTFINAQISFEKGYFISDNGTRTECFIKNMEWNYNPIEFKYKINIEDNDSKTETITNVQEFGIENNTTYKRAKVKIDISNNKIEYISTDKNPIWKDKTVFLKILVQGDANLYQYTGEDVSRFFYETKEKPLEQLIQKEYLVNDENGAKTEENNFYKQQLYNYVKGENTTQNQIKRLEYKKNQLMKYFLEYNNTDPDAIKKKINKETKNIYLFKITAGVSNATLSINSNESSGYRNAEYDTKIGPKIGFEAEYILPFNKNKWSLFANLTYQKYEDSQDYGIISGIDNGAELKYPSEVKYSGIQLPIGLRHYFFLNNNSKIFINAGYAVDINGKFTFKSKPTNLESKAEGNFIFGLGYNFKNKLSAEIRMNTNKNLLRDYAAFTSDYNTIDLMFSYTIF